MLRSPAVAGQFYPGNSAALIETLTRLIPATDEKKPVFGVMSPHAGYIYSGAVAGRTFAGVAVPDEVIILGPNHHGSGHPAAVYRQGGWETPLGPVPIAEALAEEILSSCPAVADDVQAHLYEHSLEVQVPFIRALNPAVAIAPLCIGRVPLETLLAIGDGLARAMQSRAHLPLLVASSDMTHYESGREARRKDQLALDRVLALDPEGLYRTVREHRISMCGVLPTVVMLQAALTLGATRGELVVYANSGDVTGDQSEVVGYAGVVVS